MQHLKRFVKNLGYPEVLLLLSQMISCNVALALIMLQKSKYFGYVFTITVFCFLSALVHTFSHSVQIKFVSSSFPPETRNF